MTSRLPVHQRIHKVQQNMTLKIEKVQILTSFPPYGRTSTELEETRPVWPEHEIDNSGVYFTPVKQVLMADKFINIGIGIPFPSHNTTLNGKNITEQIEQISTMRYNLWTRTGYNSFYILFQMTQIISNTIHC